MVRLEAVNKELEKTPKKAQVIPSG